MSTIALNPVQIIMIYVVQAIFYGVSR